MRFFQALLMTLAMICIASITAEAQSPSFIRQVYYDFTGINARADQPAINSFSSRSVVFAGQLALDLAPKDGEGIDGEGILYSAMFSKVVFGNERFVIPVITRFNLDDFNIVDVFDQDGITVSINPNYILVTGENPTIVHGAVEGTFDPRTAKGWLVRSFAGIEQTFSANSGKGSIGGNVYFGNKRANSEGLSYQFLASFPLDNTTSIIGAYELTKAPGAEKYERTFKLGLVAQALKGSK